MYKRQAIIRAEISRFISAHYREDISMQDAAAALRYSDAYFCKLFKPVSYTHLDVYKRQVPISTVFEAAKVFEHGGPFADLLTCAPSKVHKDTRLRTNGKLLRYSCLLYTSRCV